MVATIKSDDINDLSVDEARAVIAAVQITMEAIQAGHLDMPNKTAFHILLESAHRKLTHKDAGVIQRVN